MGIQEDRIRKIQKLLEKAESTDFPDEAKAFTDGAYKLMQEWAVTDAMLQGTHEKSEQIIVRRAEGQPGPHARHYADLLAVVADNMHCSVIYEAQFKRGGFNRYDVLIYGYERDVELVQMTFLSLQMQLEREFLTPEVQERLRISSMGNSGLKVRFKSSMIQGFSTGLHVRWQSLKQEILQDNEPGVALVLRDRDKEVEDFMNSQNPNLRSTKPVKGETDYYAYASGVAAANRADMGQPKVSSGQSPALPG